MRRILTLLALFPFACFAQRSVLYNSGDYTLYAPASFWTANSGAISNALSISVFLTQPEGDSLYQPLDTDLTRLSGIGSGTAGDIIYRDAVGWTNLARGADGLFLKSTASSIMWDTASGSGTMTGITLTNAATLPFTFSPNTTTTTNTFTLSPSNQTANTVYAGPTTGGAATPTFRALVDDDIPNTITIDLATTATTANAGDSATAFFASGTLEDARIDSAIARDAEMAALYQPLDADLTALAALSTTGIMARTGAGTYVMRTITGDSEITVSNGDGVSGNPTLAIASSITRDTELTIYKTNRTGVIREVWIPANAMNPGSDTPTASTNIWVTITDGQYIETWDFSATSTNSLYFTLTLPQAWDASTVKMKLHWKQVTAEANTTNVWAVGGGSINDAETGGNTLGTLVTVLDQGLNDTNQVAITSASSAITIGGTPSAGHLTWFAIRRHPGDSSDNMTVTTRLIGAHLQYTETPTEPAAW